MGYFNWFHSIRGHRYLNEKAFFLIRSSFPAMVKNIPFLKTLFVPLSVLKMDIFSREPRKWPQTPKIAGKIELIGKKGFSFRYPWPLIGWNQLKYPIHQPTFFILLTSVINDILATAIWVICYTLGIIVDVPPIVSRRR